METEPTSPRVPTVFPVPNLEQAAALAAAQSAVIYLPPEEPVPHVDL